MPFTIWLRSATSATARIAKSIRKIVHQIGPGLLIVRRQSSLSDFCVARGSVTPNGSWPAPLPVTGSIATSVTVSPRS